MNRSKRCWSSLRRRGSRQRSKVLLIPRIRIVRLDNGVNFCLFALWSFCVS